MKMIIDFHNHLGTDKDGEIQDFKELIESMSKYDIDYSVVFPFKVGDLVVESLKLLDISKKYPQLIPFLRFDPGQMNLDKLRTLLDNGFKGVKLHPESEVFYPHKGLDWLYTELEERKLPLLIHCKKSDIYSKPEFILAVARKYPGLPIIIAHFFGDCFTTMKESLALNNIYSDVSIFGRTLRIKQMVDKGFDRLIFGSDSPYDDQEAALMKVTKAKISDKDKNMILSDNAKKLLKIDK